MIVYPSFLWLLLLLLPLGLIMYYRYRKGKQAVRAIGGRWREAGVINVFMVKWFFSSLFFFLGIAMLVLSLSGFAWGRKTVKDERYGLDVSIVLDVSRSMNARDISPSRLEAAATFISSLVKEFPADRFSLVVVKGRGTVLVPPTEDISIVDEVVQRSSSAIMTSPGTDLEKGIREGLGSFPRGVETRQIILLFTDGESLTGNPLLAAKEAWRQGVRTFVVGCGTAEGSAIPIGEDSYAREDGELVISRLEEEELRAIAGEGKGEYFHILSPRLSETIREVGKGFNKQSSSAELRVVRKMQYRFFLIWALLFFGMYTTVRVIRWRGML
jgi:Ca-activated chloride channel homolog